MWGYSWNEIIKFYKRKNKIYYDNKKMDFDFLVKLAQACFGGGKEEGVVEKDSGEGLDTITEEQENILRAALGSDFDNLYKN